MKSKITFYGGTVVAIIILLLFPTALAFVLKNPVIIVAAMLGLFILSDKK